MDGSPRSPDENMENQTSFDLSGAIQEWRRNLAQSAAFRSADLDELEAHLRDAIPALEAAGLSSEESFLIASRRIGTRHTLESEFGKINAGRAWLNRPWLAGLLQIVTPGLGNLYSGRPLRGLILHVAVQGIWLFLALALLWLPWPVNFLIPCCGGYCRDYLCDFRRGPMRPSGAAGLSACPLQSLVRLHPCCRRSRRRRGARAGSGRQSHSGVCHSGIRG